MKYNKIVSLILLVSCIFISCGIGLLLRKNAVLEGAKFKSKSIGKFIKNANLKSLRKLANKGVNLGKGALALRAGQLQKALSDSKNKGTPSAEAQPPIEKPYDTLKSWNDATKKALDAENLASQTNKEVDIIESKTLRKTADDLYKIVMESIKYAETIAVESATTNPINHIKNIKSTTMEIINSVETDENKLTKIMNNIVLPNEPNNFEIIATLKNIANDTNITDSEKLTKLRTLVS
jgi:hypothetical protein